MSAKSFKRNRRLADAQEFDRLLKTGSRISIGNLQLKWLISPIPGALGLSIAKRHLKRAVDRNRVKRIVREAYRQGPERLNAFNIVVYLGRAPANIRSASTRRQLAQDAKRLMETTSARLAHE